MDGYMNVTELSREQLDELRNDYYFELLDFRDGDDYSDHVNDIEDMFDVKINYPEDITDEILFDRFAGVIFSSDDFACTAGQY